MTVYPAIRRVTRDGGTVWQVCCPQCETWADVDDDQLHGRVSMLHDECGWHETHDFSDDCFVREVDHPAIDIPASWGDQKGVRVKVDPAHIGAVLAETGSARFLLDELEVPAGTLRERIYSLAESFNTALEGHKDEIARLREAAEEAGRDYMRDVQAHQREESRLKKLLTEHGIDWNQPEADARCWCGWPLEPHTDEDHRQHPEWTS